MTHLDSDLTVDDLEKMKIRRELAELDKKLYQKPAFYAVVGPTLLAALTLGAGLITGQIDLLKENVRAETNWLKNEAVLLKINEENLARKTRIAKDELIAAQLNLKTKKERIDNELATALNDLAEGKRQIEITLASEREQMKSQLSQERATFNEERAAAKADHDRMTKALRDEFQTERKRLIAQRAALESQLSAVASSVAEKSAELATLKGQLKDRKTHVMIGQIKQDDNLTPHNNTLKTLISQLREQQGVRAIVKQYAASEKDIRIKSHLLYALYQASGDDNDFAALADLVEQNAADPDIWTAMAFGKWSADDELHVLEILLDAVHRADFNDLAFLKAGPFFHLPRNDFATLNTVLRSKRAFPLVERALRLAIVGGGSPVLQFYMLLTVAYYDPHLYLVVLAERIGSGMLAPDAENQFRAKAQKIRQGRFRQHKFLAKAMSDSGWPKNLRDFDFMGWLRREDIAPLGEAIEKRDYSALLSRVSPTAN